MMSRSACNGFALLTVFGSSLLVPASLPAEDVVLDYEATVATVVGKPFGIAVPRLTKVRGFFVYETEGAVDSNKTPQRGHYQLAAGGAFLARFLGHEVEGSATPFLEVEDILVAPAGTIDTFRFSDGNDANSTGGTMSLDGIEMGSIEVRLSITDDSGAAFANDSLPVLFPMGVPSLGRRLPHTFSLKDDRGTLFLQFDSLRQRVPNVVKVVAVGFDEGSPSIEFHSAPGRTYSVEFSEDVENWTPIATGVPSDGYLTQFTDAEIAKRLGALPAKGWYRVIEEPSPPK